MLFEDETLLFEETLRHSTEEIAQYASIVDQKDFRKNIILNLLKGGGIAYNKYITDQLEAYAGFIAPFTVYPGEDELLVLVQGGLRVLNGEEEAKAY